MVLIRNKQNRRAMLLHWRRTGVGGRGGGAGGLGAQRIEQGRASMLLNERGALEFSGQPECF